MCQNYSVSNNACKVKHIRRLWAEVKTQNMNHAEANYTEIQPAYFTSLSKPGV